MEFEWDDAKSASNERDRALSFADAALIFDGIVMDHIGAEANRRERERWLA